MVRKGGRRLSGKMTIETAATQVISPKRSDNAAGPITAREARLLFVGFGKTPAIVLAVSGGPDSTALMALAARWRKAVNKGPKLIAVTVDHGLRREAAAEARTVAALARTMGVEHHTLRWRGAKPGTGLPSAARDARYRLLTRFARDHGSACVLTAHTRDDQAETVLMRLSRGSGLAGLAAMARLTERDGVVLARPLLDVPKARLMATLKKAGIASVTDPTNLDLAFTRPRLRALMPALAAEGCDARNLARLATRLARANTALELLADAAEAALVRVDERSLSSELDAGVFFAAPEEIRLRLLMRAVDRAGREGPAELGKAEALLRGLDAGWRVVNRKNKDSKTMVLFKQTLAGAVISLRRSLVLVEPAPPRRLRRAQRPKKP